MRRLLLLILIAWPAAAQAGPLTKWQDWVLNNPLVARRIPPSALVAKGTTDTDYYVLEVNPLTGGLAVEATFSATSIGVSNLPTTVDTNYGTPGASTLRSAAMLGVGAAAVSNANPVPVSDAGGSLTVDGTVGISGTVAATQSGTWNVTNISGTVSLPTGASTAANQSTGNTSLASIDTKTPALGQTTMSASQPVAIASNQSSIPISNLPTTVDTNSGTAGASTPRVVLATRHESASTPISVRISNGTSFSTAATKGRAYADSKRYDYTTGSVGTVSWVQLIAATAADINALTIFDSCGETLELGVGAAASETRQLIIPPGGLEGSVPLYIPSGTRVSVRALSATCSSGELDLTGLN